MISHIHIGSTLGSSLSQSHYLFLLARMHGIAMPKGLYFTAVVSSAFFLLSFF